MSLQYIIDGYNLLHHKLLTLNAGSVSKDPQNALLEFIQFNALCGSAHNKITVIFDGYPEGGLDLRKGAIEVIFSRDKTADERINALLESSRDVKNIRVVSDDKQIRLFARGIGAQSVKIEDFLQPLIKRKRKQDISSELKLSYSKQLEITRELRKIWLK
ncbi:MAG: NYN domain-containing protein [Candidatus Omnitrophica bacterium]|nr:NYN domain-containing protein [Candidatus Omnitrophota bacterium]